jgi:hypothetical protein
LFLEKGVFWGLFDSLVDLLIDLLKLLLSLFCLFLEHLARETGPGHIGFTVLLLFIETVHMLEF